MVYVIIVHEKLEKLHFCRCKITYSKQHVYNKYILQLKLHFAFLYVCYKLSIMHRDLITNPSIAKIHYLRKGIQSTIVLILFILMMIDIN